MKKTTQLKTLIAGKRLQYICEAHNGLSAKIVEEQGFPGIWASGLAISSAFGVRDNNEASWTQVLETIEFMSDATTIPILLDGDTGYGNFNNMQRLVKKLEQRDIAGVCIEDKLFPKTNSFIDSDSQPLADIDEFCGKIKAGKDIQTDDDFCIVARIEAFIAGWGLEEALKRAEAYRRAGADAILVHSKKSHPADIEMFMREWENRHPIVIVPTKYYSTPTQRFRELNISVIIWANHMIRSCVAAMQKTVRQIYTDESLVNVEDTIVPVSELFRLQGASTLQRAEKKYLPTKGAAHRAIILAASRGIELGDMTAQIPKAMLKINNVPIITGTVNTLNKLGVKDITVVRGYAADRLKGANFVTIDNARHSQTKDLYSLYLARTCVEGEILIAYGDCMYRSHLIADVLAFEGDIKIVVDADFKGKSKSRDLVTCSRPYTNDFFIHRTTLKDIFVNSIQGDAHGEWTGLIAANSKGTKCIKATLEDMAARDDFESLSLTDLLKELLRVVKIHVVYTKGGWLDIDNLSDFRLAGGF